MRRFLSGLMVVVCAALLAGCGGGDSGGKLSASEFKERANEACKRANDRLEKLKRPTDLASAADYAKQAEPIARDLADDLDDLQPPDDEKAKVDKMRATLRTGVDNISKLREAAEKRDIAGIRKYAGALSSSDLDAQASALGLNECAKNVQPSG